MSNLTLYQISQDHRELAERLQDMDLDEQAIADTLEAESGLVEKSQAVAFVIRNLESFAEQVKAEADAMAERAKAVQKRADAVKGYLHTCMLNAGVSKIEHPQFTLSVAKNPASVVILDERQIPALYMRIPDIPEPVPDKKAIAAALKSGLEVPGAKLDSEKTSLRIK